MLDFKRKSAYLAGSMSGLKGLGSEWRRPLQRWLEDRGQSVFNPCEYEKKILNSYKIKVPLYKWEVLPIDLRIQIMDRDGEHIERSTNFVICYWTRPSTGTVSELFLAFRKRIPVYFVSKRKIRGWPGTVAEVPGNRVFREFSELKNFLAHKYKLREKK